MLKLNIFIIYQTMNLVAFILFSIFFAQSSASCPDGSVEFQNHCYFFETNATNFPNAELVCNKLNGHLASIHDGFTNAIITGQSGNFFHESTVTNFWVGLNALISPGNWSWTDNSTFDFIEWAPSEPQNLTMNCGTVTIQSGLWASDDCFKTKPFVCSVPIEIYPPFVNCSTGWIYFEPTHSCYGNNGYGNFYAANWTRLESLCEAQGAHLVSLHSHDEASFVSTMLKDVYLWTGLTSNDNGNTWKWSDGSPVDYLQWASGYPSRTGSSCVFLFNAEICDYDCGSIFHAICKKPALL